MKTEFFECQCHSDEHTLKFSLDEEDGTIYCSTYLNNFYPWWYKLWVAVKYVFGYKSKFGHWDCCLLRFEDHHKMVDLIKRSTSIQLENKTKPMSCD